MLLLSKSREIHFKTLLQQIFPRTFWKSHKRVLLLHVSRHKFFFSFETECESVRVKIMLLSNNRRVIWNLQAERARKCARRLAWMKNDSSLLFTTYASDNSYSCWRKMLITYWELRRSRIFPSSRSVILQFRFLHQSNFSSEQFDFLTRLLRNKFRLDEWK